jgi:hypothetical protein
VWEVDYDDTGGIWKGKNDGNRVEGWLGSHWLHIEGGEVMDKRKI